MTETISIHYVDKALWITEKLLNTSNFRKPLVFLHKSSCLEELGRLDEAIDVLRELRPVFELIFRSLSLIG